MNKKRIYGFLCVLVFGATLLAQQSGTSTPPDPGSKPALSDSQKTSMVIPSGAKVFVAPMPDNFDEFIRAAIAKKKVPVVVVTDRNNADYEITGYSETQKASTAKKVITLSWHSRESASIKVADLKTSTIVFAYSYNNDNSAHGKKTSAESCAKHLKEKIESQK